MSLPEVARIVSRGVVVEQRALSELDALMPPAQAAHNWRRLIGYIRVLIGQTMKLGDYARSNNIKGVQAVSTASMEAMRELALVARAVGVKECSRIS